MVQKTKNKKRQKPNVKCLQNLILLEEMIHRRNILLIWTHFGSLNVSKFPKDEQRKKGGRILEVSKWGQRKRIN